MDELEKFLKGAVIGSADHSENKSQSHQNGNASSREVRLINFLFLTNQVTLIEILNAIFKFSSLPRTKMRQ